MIRESTDDLARGGIWGWVDDDLAFVKPWGFDIAEITVPVEVRYGLTDVLVPAAHGAWLATHVPNATVVAESRRGTHERPRPGRRAHPVAGDRQLLAALSGSPAGAIHCRPEPRNSRMPGEQLASMRDSLSP